MFEEILAAAFLGLIVAAAAVGFEIFRRRRARMISLLIKAHFAPTRLEDITVSERLFPFRVRADLQRAVNRLFSAGTTIRRFCGVKLDFSMDGINLGDCIGGGNPMFSAVIVPPQYEEVDVVDAEPVRCLKNGLWLLQEGPNKYVVLLAPAGRLGSK